MTPHTREHRLVETFVTMADSLVADYDVVDLLQTLVERSTSLFDVQAAGILLRDGERDLEVIASTSEESRFVGLMQLRAGEGPCIEAVVTGAAVSVPDVRAVTGKWPTFAEEALSVGIAAVHAIPMRLRAETIGSLNLFNQSARALDAEDAVAAQALADVATIGILQERAHQQIDTTRAQLQRALDSRVVIEQAKGFLSYVNDVDMDEAFSILRRYARSNHRRIAEVAADVVARRITL